MKDLSMEVRLLIARDATRPVVRLSPDLTPD